MSDDIRRTNPKLDSLYFKALKAAAKTRRASSGGRRIPAAERGPLIKTARRSARAKLARTRMSTDFTNMDLIAKLFGLPTSEKLMEYESDAYHYAYNQALKDGESEEKAEEKAQAAEQEEQDENYGKWYDAVERVAEKFFGEHGLEVVPRSAKSRKHPRPFDLKVAPKKSWNDAADKIRETINGVGYFHFNSLKEFMDSGPYTAREAVLNHIGYVPQWAEVYGDTSPQSMYDRHVR